jgi:putative glutamine amidotransferase
MWLFNRLAVWRAGGKAIKVTAKQRPPIETLDGLIIGGGDDIDARLYGGELSVDVRIDPERDELELDYLASATTRDIPILGVCRGAQILNVFHGGTLHHDIYGAYAGLQRRRTPLPRLPIEIEQDTQLAAILGQDACRVNALHHQSVDRPGKGFLVAARDRDGVVQAICRKGQPLCLGVQWHPEFLVFDSGQQNLFRALVDAARNDQAARQDGNAAQENGLISRA